MSEHLPQRLTIAEAAKATGKSPDQIRRAIYKAKRNEAGGLAHTIDPTTNAYLITVEALLAAGYELRSETPPASDQTAEIERLRAEIARLQTQISEADKWREALEVLARALGGATPPASQSPANPSGAQTPAQPRKVWHWYWPRKHP